MINAGKIFIVDTDGGWSRWSSWRACSHKCGGGFRMRERSCDSPTPKYGGTTCRGDYYESSACNTDRCPGKLDVVVVLIRNPFKICFDFPKKKTNIILTGVFYSDFHRCGKLYLHTRKITIILRVCLRWPISCRHVTHSF